MREEDKRSPRLATEGEQDGDGLRPFSESKIPSLSTAGNVKAIAQALACGRHGCGCGKREGAGWTTHCPAHVDVNPSLSVADGDGGKVLAHCHAGCSQDAVLGALRARRLWPEAKRTSRQRFITYDYVDGEGALLYQTVRYLSPKDFRQRRPDGKGGWVWNLDGVRRVPYRLPELLAADPAEWVYVVEGEKDADALARLSLVTTTNPGGAGKWREEFGPHLKDRRVAILPDNDAAGLAHAQDVAHKLTPYAAEIRIVVLPGLSPGGDVSDWVKNGHTAEELAALVEATPAYEPPPAVDGATLLDDVVAFIRRYVILKDEQADALALWVFHTYALEAADATPYINVGSPEKRSGKTRLLEVLSLLVHRPWFTGRVTAAVLVRKLATQTPTLLLDESDAAFRAEKEYAAALQAILNAGYRRGGCASLCVKSGADFELKDFPVFGPKAIAGIGKLPDTIADRAISITLKRRAPNEPVNRFRLREAQEEARPLHDALSLWAAANIGALAEARPDLPPELDDRAADCWEGLLAVADLVGGDWPETARKSARVLSAGEWRDDDSLGVQLLTDIRTAFGKDTHLSTVDLLKRVGALPESPWLLSPVTLAQHLKGFGVKPKPVRIGQTVSRGYEARDFEDAWLRYVLIPEKGVTGVTPVTSDEPKYNTKGQGVTPVTDVTANTGIQAPLTEPDDPPSTAPCPHRPAGEVEDRWAHGDGGPDAHACDCCGGPVRPDLWVWADGLCPVCRNGRQVKAGSGHLVRLTLDAGAKVVGS